jgi:hypothetical protein
MATKKKSSSEKSQRATVSPVTLEEARDQIEALHAPTQKLVERVEVAKKAARGDEKELWDAILMALVDSSAGLEEAIEFIDDADDEEGDEDDDEDDEDEDAD